MLARSIPEIEVEERRDERRHTILVRANIELPNQMSLKGHAVDLSRGGMGLQCPVEVPAGREIIVTLTLEACGERREIKLGGAVCYCRKQSENHFRIGMRFVHLDEPTRAFITAICP